MTDTEHQNDPLAKLCFRAYAAAVGGQNVAGKPIPSWDQLGPTVQGGWVAAADAVANYLMEPDEPNDQAQPGDY